MSYCTVADVQSLNKARVIGAQGQPTTSDVQGYINMVAGEIDAILTDKGYAVPIPPIYPEAIAYLNAINATGAWHLMERSSQTSPNLDRAKAAWDTAIAKLVAAKSVMDVPKDVQRAEPRGPGVTPSPLIAPGNRPYFRRHEFF